MEIEASSDSAGRHSTGRGGEWNRPRPGGEHSDSDSGRESADQPDRTDVKRHGGCEIASPRRLGWAGTYKGCGKTHSSKATGFRVWVRTLVQNGVPKGRLRVC